MMTLNDYQKPQTVLPAISVLGTKFGTAVTA